MVDLHKQGILTVLMNSSASHLDCTRKMHHRLLLQQHSLQLAGTPATIDLVVQHTQARCHYVYC